ncbi:hypothetical protein HMPREF0201_01699 [Cedecea davisae DSM 4568]|uniref:Uncharacterized protein n=1 Tax=Cedecea davisae DSM 4568 TaxID=566551 RepID=S3JXH9_9ENTR|nr:hypothetical protein HMPREF0201_01699 [Cedecea davisae DSM 4568]
MSSLLVTNFGLFLYFSFICFFMSVLKCYKPDIDVGYGLLVMDITVA